MNINSIFECTFSSSSEMMFSPTVNLDEFIKQLTLEEKASFCSGDSFWYIRGIERLGLPRINMTDGPHGLRKADESVGNTTFGLNVIATCFPPACCVASSWDPEVTAKLGATVAEECIAEGCSIILGPGCNIKRSPLCGRNFEYYSEDPVLSSQMAKGMVQGAQGKNVGTSLKHFFGNNQELNRYTYSSIMDERTAREIYLRSFEDTIKEAQPWTVMCCYNAINGVFGSENTHALREVLKDEWGFEGFVVSDWGASNFRPDGVRAGMDLQMPGPDEYSNNKVAEYVKNGKLDVKYLDDSVKRILRVVQKAMKVTKREKFSFEEHDKIAKEIATESMVLLKNDGILPLQKGKKVAFIGPYAKEPRYQGSGSSFINTWKVTSALKAMESYKYAEVKFAQGCVGDKDEGNKKLLDEAVAVAKEVGTVVLFLGLPDSYEAETVDRTHMNIPECQAKLLEEVAKVAKKTVLVLHNGSPVVMPYVGKMNAIVEAYLGGQNVGSATIEVLYGDVNPSGKLAESFPLEMEHNPSHGSFGHPEEVVYTEGIFVGYRFYQRHKTQVLFPFGHGLSYTTFSYSGLKLNKTSMKDNETLEVSFSVKNTGKVAGKEVVQLYVADEVSSVPRPVRELKKFAKIFLKPGESKEVKFSLSFRDFAFWSTKLNKWYVETGSFSIEVGASSEDIKLTQKVHVESTTVIPFVVEPNTLMGKIAAHPATKELGRDLSKKFLAKMGDLSAALGAAGGEAMADDTTSEMPLRSIVGIYNDPRGLDCLIDQFNALLKK